MQFVDPPHERITPEQLRQAGYFFAFLYLMCGASRLARFNITKNPVPKNPGKPDRKYFVGMPIPSAASFVAAVVYAFNGAPLRWWAYSAVWLGLLALLSYLMVCTWRYQSFKDVNLTRPRSFLTFIVLGSAIYLVWNFSRPVLLVLATCYVASGITIRVGGIVRRHLRSSTGAK